MLKGLKRMIMIRKLEKPDILVRNAEKWTKEYCSCLNAGQKPSNTIQTRYNEPSIKARLIEETHGKCAYCESKITHIAYGDIDHILPKNKGACPELYVEWENLTLACELCNRSGKRDYYNPELLLINPYVDNPEEHFMDLGEFIISISGDDRARITNDILKLNRTELIERRKERIDLVAALLELWAREQNTCRKNTLEQQLHEQYSEEKEFSSTIKAYLKANDFPVH